jgi:chromosome segregation ATPase
MTPGQQNRRERIEEMRRRQQADEKVRELEKQIRRLEGHCSEYERALHGAYAMLERYADQISDEAYQAIKAEIAWKTERFLSEEYEHPLQEELAEGFEHPLEEEVERLRDTLASLRRPLKFIAGRTDDDQTREDAHQAIVDIAQALYESSPQNESRSRDE